MVGFDERFFPRHIFPDDIFIVSYPKSGNTWLRFLIGNALTGNQCDFSNLRKVIPDIYRNRADCDDLSRPRMMKTHLPYSPKMRRAIYLVRDGRDVAVSYYYHLLKKERLDQRTTFDEYLSLFTQGLIAPRLGSWNSHTLSWLDHLSPNILLVMYENLKKDTAHELEQILSFLGLQRSHDEIAAAVAASDFERMKTLEQQQSALYHDFANTNQGIAFVRAGQAGEWAKYFSEQASQDFIARHGEALRRLHYIAA